MTAALLDLQAEDLAMDRLRARLRAIEAGEDLAAARDEADAAETSLGELRLQIESLDRDGRRLEHEIDSLQQKAGAEERRLFDGSIANAKELDSIRHEVENLRRRVSDREDELLALLEQRDALEALAKEAEAVATERRGRAEQVLAESGEEGSRIRAELAERDERRASVATTIDGELLELYEDLRLHKKGVGAAALVDGVCQGCHEQLSAVELDRLKHTDGVKRCEHCRRILVL
jgi:predicted  nucleic acid-binding Zn-ribbon protein